MSRGTAYCGECAKLRTIIDRTFLRSWRPEAPAESWRVLLSCTHRASIVMAED